MYPWVSISSTLVVLSSIAICRKAFESRDSQDRVLLLVVAGVVASLLLWLRPLIYVALVALLLPSLTIRIFSEARYVLSGATAGAAFGLGLVTGSSWFPDYLEQVWVWPRKHYAGGARLLASTLAPLLEEVRFLLPLGLLLVALVWTANQARVSPRVGVSLSALAVTSGVALEIPNVLLAILAAQLLIMTAYSGGNFGPRLWPWVYRGQFASILLIPAFASESPLFRHSALTWLGGFSGPHPFPVSFLKNSLSLFSLAGMFILIFMLAIATIGRAQPYRMLGGNILREHTGSALFVCAVYGLANQLEIASIADTRHLWWAAPIPILVVVEFGVRMGLDRIAIPVLIVFAGMAAWSGFSYWSLPRVEIEGGVGHGMRVNAPFGAIYQDALHQSEVIFGDGKVFYIAHSGLYASIQGGFSSSSPMFVNWGPNFNFEGLCSARFAFVEGREWTELGHGNLLAMGFVEIQPSDIAGNRYYLASEDAKLQC